MKLGTFWKCEDPPPNFELFPTETWDFFKFFDDPTPLFGLIPKFRCFFDWKASLREYARSVQKILSRGGEHLEGGTPHTGEP